jgi:hypothetical protein
MEAFLGPYGPLNGSILHLLHHPAPFPSPGRREGAELRVVLGLCVSGQMKLRRIKGYRDIGGRQKAAAWKKRSS